MRPMADMVETGGEHSSTATVRTCEVCRDDAGASCGFHLTRSRWDPYPWVSAVEAGSAADLAGLRSGDCVLEVNGQDVLGQRIAEVATRVRALPHRVTLLVWNPGSDLRCNPESLCCGPMPDNLERLSACLRIIVSVLECPVCLDTIPPPAHQCANGHLICMRCRVHTDRCPVCRVRFCRGRSLLADEVYNALTEAFQLRRGDGGDGPRPSRLRERIFGCRKGSQRSPQRKTNSTITSTPTNKFLTRIMGKSSSVDNLSSDNVRLSSLPRYLSDTCEFNPTLKAKSLSTSEIFPLHSSRTVSRSPSSSRLTEMCSNFKQNRPASYHGSYEHLNGGLSCDFIDNIPHITDDGSLYYCPCDQECPSLMKASGVMNHIQECHDGPIVHYFKHNILLSLPLAMEKSAIIAISYDNSTFFLKADKQVDSSWHVWLWILGTKKEAESYQLLIILRGGAHEVTERSSVLSLSSTSWTDVQKGQRGVYLQRDSLHEHFPAETRTGCPIGMLVCVQQLTSEGGD